LHYSGDGAFQGFHLRTASGVADVPANSQRLAQVLADALARDLTVAIVRELEEGPVAEVRLLPP
jgi:hypothetical protein